MHLSYVPEYVQLKHKKKIIPAISIYCISIDFLLRKLNINIPYAVFYIQNLQLSHNLIR